MKTILFAAILAMLIAITSRAETLYWFDNFDTNGASRWTASSSGTWKIGSPTAGPAVNSHGYRTYSGADCATTQGYTPANQSVRLTCTNYNGAKTLLVPSASQYPRLRFWQWFSFANALAYVEISTDSGSSWIQVTPTIPASLPGQTGLYSGVWGRPSVDLRPYAGQHIQIAFFFEAGGSIGNGLGWFVDDVEVATGAPVLNNPESFESGQGDWAVSGGVWQIGQPTSGPGSAHSGVQCAATTLSGSYVNDGDSRLISPAFLVPTNGTQTLSFWHWYDFNNALGYIEISTDGNTWTTLTTDWEDTSSGGWENDELDLSSYAGQSVQIAFHFTSGGFDTAPGWYIDDVEFPQYIPPLVQITAAASLMSPGLGDDQFVITRTGGSTGALTINLAAGGTAVPGTEYTNLPASVNLPANVTSASLDVALLPTANITTAKTIELGIVANQNYDSGLYTNAVITVMPLSALTNSVVSPVGRYWRGSGSDPTYWSQVVPLEYETGTIYSNVTGNCSNLYPGLAAWSSQIFYHYNATNTLGQSNPANRIPFDNPIVAFGERVGGTPLYFNEAYSFGVYAGGPFAAQPQIIIQAYSRTNLALAGTIVVPTPNYTNAAAMDNYVTNGVLLSTNAFGLTTTLSDAPGLNWGNTWYGAYILTHQATSLSTNYYYVVADYGDPNSSTNPMTITSGGIVAPSILYSLEFESRPPWRAVMLDQPNFAGQPMPPIYAGKTVAEILTNTPPVTNVVNFTPSAATNLDDSPELRRHPYLDSFVASLGNDPIALANYVINNIDLTDPMDYSDSGNISEQSIDPGGVSRGALGTFMEKQGSAADQCALLVYLLRQAGVPAVYEFAPRNGLQMLDARLDNILKFQVHGGFNQAGQLYTTNTLIPVNYPWVAAYIGTNWVHIFPWLKDYEITEGFNLYDYMPSNYPSAYPWVHDYLFGNSNLLSLATNGDNTPRVILPAYLQQMLWQNHPGISMDDLGVQIQNRQHYYARWQDFPTPTWVTNVSTPLESLTASNLAGISPTLTNVFDTVSVEIYSVNNPSEDIQTGDLRLTDLHNREFYINQTSTNATAVQLNLVLMPFRTNITAQAAFSNDANLLSKEVLTLNLVATDDQLNVRFRYKRHRALSPAYPINSTIAFLGLSAAEEEDFERPLRKGDQAAICLNYGRVTTAMLNVHAANLLQMENTLKANPAATNTISPDKYLGETMYLAGMSYFEKLSEFNQFNQNLHKVDILSIFGAGLSKIIPARNSSGTLTNGIDPVLPCVDMFLYQMATVGNGTVKPNSGQTLQTSQQNFNLMTICNGSAEEHQTINRFYQQTNAVSTARLLQLAQSSGTGILTLTPNNYVAMGQNTYQGQQLQNWDASMWSEVSGDLQNWSYSFAYMTPGPISNKSYSGMGTMIFGFTTWMALISPESLNGGFGQYWVPDTMSPVNASNFNLVYNNDDPTIGLDKPASGTTLASSEVPTWNVPTVASQIQNGSVIVTPFESTAWSNAGANLGVAGSGSADQSYANIMQTVALYGNEGNPGNAGNSLLNRVLDPVNSITGEFYVDETDLHLPGPLPLTLRRNYSSQNLADNQFGVGWKLSIMPYLSVAVGATNIYAADMDGAVLAYVQVNPATNVWMPTVAANPLLDNNSVDGAGGLANRLRDRIVQTTNASTTNYTLFGADGSTRNFQVMTFNNGILTNTRPYLTQWTDSRGNYFLFGYDTNATDTAFGQMTWIQCSNGNYLGFDYDIYGHIIDAYTGDGRWSYYEYDGYGDLVAVTLPDGSQHSYVYQHGTQAVTNGTAIYSSHLVIEADKPDGRVLQNAYDSQRRVTNQMATAGLNLVPIRTATFIYSNNYVLTNSYTNTITGHTWVVDGNNHTNQFDYINGLITQFTDPLGLAIQQIWFTNNSTVPGYYPRSVAIRIDKRGLTTQYQYDANGNVTNTVVTGDLLGDGVTSETATNTALYNSNSLPLQLTDPAGNSIATVYDPVFNFLPQQVIHLASGTPVSTNFTIYGNATNVVVAGKVTDTNYAFGLPVRQIQAYNSPDAATNDFAYNGYGFLTQSIRYTGTGDPNVINTFVYNERGQMVNRIDSLGAVTFFDYDPMDRPTEQGNFDEFGNVLAWSFNYYNDNGELEWVDGPRYNPEDYIFYDYDGEGRRTTEIHWLSQANSNGTGVMAPSGNNLYAQSFYQFDPVGNLTLAVDPRGAMTTNTFDADGRMVQSVHLDTNGETVLSRDGFTYENGGLVHCHTNALGGVTTTLYTSTGKPEYQSNPDGSTNTWRYLLDGRVRQQVQGNGAYWQTTYDDVNRITTRIFCSAAGVAEATNSVQLDRRGNSILSQDAGGNAFVTTFDGLNRPKTSAGPTVTYTTSVVTGNPPTSPTTLTNTVQQVVTNFYDAAGRALTNLNAVGEMTVTTKDALGRDTGKQLYSSSGTLVRQQYRTYSTDHNRVTVTDGSGADAITHTYWTDTGGHQVLSIAYPSSGTTEFTLNQYDLAGNLVSAQHDSSANGIVTTWTTTTFAYDGLNRATSKYDRDNAQTMYAFDGLSDVTNRTVPGKVQWQAIYNPAGQIKQEQEFNGGTVTRTTAYNYYPGTSPFAGRLLSKTDGRGVTSTYVYDDWLRPTNIASSGLLPEQSMTTTFQYEPRGYMTGITEQFATNTTGPITTIQRSFDPYGQLASESVSGTVSSYTANQNWDSAGRRILVSLGDISYDFGWQADGALVSVGNSTGSGVYSYTTSGILTNRLVGNRQTSIAALDGEGRPLIVSNSVNLASQLAETMTWSGDGLLAVHTLDRNDFGWDNRAYTYASATRRLTQEQLNLNAATTWTNTFVYDGGTASGPGALTAAGQLSGGTASWTGGTDAFSRINTATNSLIPYTAFGHVNGQSTLSAWLDSLPVSVTGEGTNAMQWRASMELTQGAHQLLVAAAHPSGQYIAWATNSFTNSLANETASDTFDGAGNITNRVWRNPSGGVERTQGLSWDARGRLHAVIERDANSNGYNWTATYDGVGRRLTTTSVIVTNNVAYTCSPTIITSYYDPQVEFLELGVSYGRTTEWKLYGPDLNGTYGGLNGTGGLEAVSPFVSPYLYWFEPLISDFRGNVLAVESNSIVQWNPARPAAYGAVPGCRPVALGSGADISLASAWRGHWPDITGYYNVGLRPYDPVSGRWLTFDSVWSESDPNAYSFAGGDPVNGFDPDGRCTENTPTDVYFGVAPIMQTSLATTVTFNDGSIATTGLPGQAPLMYDSSSVYDTSKSIVTAPTGQYGYYFSSSPLPANYGQYSSTPYTTGDPDQQARIQFLADLGIVATTALTGTEEAAPELLAPDSGAFANYMRQAQTLDVSTAENGAVFYSGPGNRALAEQFATANGRTTLEMTPGGAWLDQQQLFNTAQSGLTTEQAAQVWSTLSQRFAQGASGNAVGFVNGARAGSIFNTVESPALFNNPNVVNVITGGH